MPENHQITIIGAGLAGLSSACYLSSQGYDVLLIEKHTKVGGCATTFDRKDYTFEVGLHAINQLEAGQPCREVLNQLGVFENLSLQEIPEFYRYEGGDLKLTLPWKVEDAKGTLLDSFLDQLESIEKYFADIELANSVSCSLLSEDGKIDSQASSRILQWQSQSIAEYLNNLTNSEDLKLVLLGNLGYYHDNPYELNAFYFLFGQAGFHHGGTFYIKGGSQALSDALKDKFLEQGGKLLLRHTVKSLRSVADGGFALEIATRGAGEDLVVQSGYVIANCAIPALMNDLLEPREARKLQRKYSKLLVAPSLSNIYLGFNRSLDEVGVDSYTTFFHFAKEQGMIEYEGSLDAIDYSKIGVCLVDYSKVDHGLKTPDHCRGLGVICSIDYASRWNSLSREQYKQKKREWVDSIIQRIDQEYPGFAQCIDYKEASTPLTIEKFTGNTLGSPYGYAQTVRQSTLLRPNYRSPIPGLYLASAWSRPGGGFSSAILCGYRCAKKLDHHFQRTSAQTGK